MKWLAHKVLIVSVLTVHSRVPPDQPKARSFIDHVNAVSKKISIDINEDPDSDMESSVMIDHSVSSMVQTRDNTSGSKNGEGHHTGEVLNTDADATRPLNTRKGFAAGEELVGGQCLTFSEEALNWQDAADACSAAGGRLVIPTDPAALADYVADTYGNYKRFWVGGSDIEEEGTFKWSNGDTIPLDQKDFPWSNRQPDNYDAGENCLEVYHNGGYNDDFCTRKNRYICERVATNSTVEIDKILSSTVPTFGGGEADKTIDGNIYTHWNVNKPKNLYNWYMEFKLKKRYTVTSLELHNYGDTTHDITSFKLEASNDGNIWRVIKTWSDEVFKGLKTFDDFTATTSYLKFTVTKTLSGWQPYLGEISFTGYVNDQGCAAGEELVGGQYLTFGEKRLTWRGSVTACRAAGGRLAIPADPAALAQYVVDTYGDYKAFWVGGSDIEEEGTWKYINGDIIPLDHKDFPWATYEPNDLGIGQDCLRILLGAYYDLQCNARRRYICEPEE